MCSGFDKYLETFRLFVMFGVNDDSIIQLYLCMVPLIKQIRVLAKVLTIHPDGKYFSLTFLLLKRFGLQFIQKPNYFV